VWDAWQNSIKHCRHVKHTLANAIMRICHRSTAIAFSHWREFVVISKMLRLQEQEAVQHLQQLLLQQFWAAWRSTVAQKQQHKVGQSGADLPSPWRSLQFLSCKIYWIACMMDHVHGDVEVEFRWKTCILAGHEAPKADMCIWLSHRLQHGWHSCIRPSQKRLPCCRQMITYSVAHTNSKLPLLPQYH
jgi:hypothetical protein